MSFLLMLVAVLILWRLLPYLLRGADGIAGLAGEGAPSLIVFVMVLVTALVGLMALVLVARY